MPCIYVRAMHYVLAILILACAPTGCRSSRPEASPEGSNRSASATLVTNRPSVRPVEALNGRVIAVRDSLRFVIVDFPNSRMPQLEQRLSVYRLDQKVAEVKVSGPYFGTTVAADITAGQASEGDLVRDR